MVRWSKYRAACRFESPAELRKIAFAAVSGVTRAGRVDVSKWTGQGISLGKVYAKRGLCYNFMTP